MASSDIYQEHNLLVCVLSCNLTCCTELLQKLVVHLLGHEVLLCVVRNQLTLYLAMYESFTTLQQTNVQVFVATR